MSAVLSLRDSTSRVKRLGIKGLPNSKPMRGIPQESRGWTIISGGRIEAAHLPHTPAQAQTPSAPSTPYSWCHCPDQMLLPESGRTEFAEFGTREPGPTPESPRRPGRLEKARWQVTRVCKARERATARVKGGWVGALTTSDQKGNQSRGLAPVTCPPKPGRTTFKPGRARSGRA